MKQQEWNPTNTHEAGTGNLLATRTYPPPTTGSFMATYYLVQYGRRNSTATLSTTSMNSDYSFREKNAYEGPAEGPVDKN